MSSSLAKLPEDEIGDSADLVATEPSLGPHDDAEGGGETGSNGEVTLQTEGDVVDPIDEGENEAGEEPDSGTEDEE